MITQPPRDFVRVGSLSLWRGANFAIARGTTLDANWIALADFDMARATLSALGGCWIALAVVQCEF